METQSFSDRQGLIWHNGDLTPWQDSKLHILTHGLHYASCVFEGERVYDGSVFKLTEHSERLVHSAQVLGFELPYPVEQLDRATREVVSANRIADGYVRPVAWRGSEMMGVSAQHNRINVAIAAWVWPSYFAPEERFKGIRLKISQWRRPAPDTAPVKSKAAGLYMICTLAKHAAEAAGYQDALMLDWRGRVAEATGANIFFTRGRELHTPIPDCFLDGITRRTVIAAAKARGYQVIERAISPPELADFEECFLTGTAAEVTPVREIDDVAFKPGPVCQQMIEDYEGLVRHRVAA